MAGAGMKVVVIQKGAREHFLAARALHRQGLLEQLVVDWYAPLNPMLRRVGGWANPWIGGRGRSALAARAPEIPDRLVRPNRINGFFGKWKQGLNPFGRSTYDNALRSDIAFTQTVARLNFPPHDVFFGYSYMSLEMLEMERERKVLTILDQIDPGPAEFRLVAEAMAQNPEIAGMPPPFPTKYYDRLRQEWKLADVIVVNSEWSREALVSEGVEAAKIEILPLAYEAEDDRQKSERSILNSQLTTAPLRVLWLGQVNVRKGIHCLMAAARLLEREKIHFDVVGPIGILPGAVASAPGNMTFHGPVSRDRAADWYQQSDVFVLPTLSDGFALTQLEAMAHGLPVIATPNCGRVVVEGKTGFIVSARDAQALAEAVLRVVRAPDLAVEMGLRCREAVKAYSVDAYGRHLVEIIQKHMGSRGADYPIQESCQN
jgi:glycosyltransferase involved in cell wall biosynthesis